MVLKKSRTLSLVGLAAVLYLVADVVSAAGGVSRAGLVVAAVASLLALAPFVVRDGGQGARRVGALGVAAALALVGHVAPHALSLVAEVVEGLAYAAVAALVVDLALTAPDRPRALAAPWLRLLPWLVSGFAALVGLLAALPALTLGGDALLVPPAFAGAPPAAALVAVLVAIALRAARRRLGSGPDALAANAWAQLGAVPAAVLGAVALAGTAAGALSLESPWARSLVGLAGLTLVVGHVRLVDPRERPAAGRATRRAVATALTLMAVGAVAASLHELVPRESITLGLFAAATLLAAAGLYRALHPLVAFVLAPARGRLLEAIDVALARLVAATTLDEVARAVLGPLRDASRKRDAAPQLYTVAPPRVARIDAAGEPHLETRELSAPLLARLVERPGELIERAPLEARIVRRPLERPLLDALVALDALVVVPLSTSGELDGVLVVPRGRRGSGLALEELAALEKLGAALAARVAVLTRAERADGRAAAITSAHDREEERAAALDEELTRLRADLRVLKAGPAADRLATPPVAYAPATRALVARVAEVAPLDAPVLLVGESGTGLEVIAVALHAQSSRARGPFVVADCGAVRPERSEAALLGEEGAEGGAHPGWLRLAAGGTLFLVDVPALSREAQRALAEALAVRQARAVGGAGAYAVDTRIIATSQRALEELLAASAFDAELGQWLAPLALDVPALRDRREDLPSLVLLALDRAARTLGREPVGIDPVALEVLLTHAFPGNLRELQSVIDRAVRASHGSKVTRADLPPLSGTAHTEDPLGGTYEAIERRILEHALLRASGNKSEAARLLGLKRTTFLDKLRRYKLDDGARDSEHPVSIGGAGE
jgi:two-component system response regulator HydG